ncbi:MAG: hypothetical protein C3F07_11930 [Anaerolineales bacterium]|nr:hypothetical protein [Anaerolineae bacterium]PWB72489.1 MAG: hypothetical protein C3F07_11930 [Anaerolineales bacterium]
MDKPNYAYPRGLFAKVALDALLLHRRNFRKDAITCIGNLHPPLRILGEENIPGRGPCVVTVNHYHREGFGAEWIALAIAATVPADMHWVMTGEWTYPGQWYAPLGSMYSRFILHRLARLYGFTSMPPMPPRPQDVEARARSVRAVLDVVRNTKDLILGLAPEGHDPPGGVLTRPASGAGRFGLLLANAGLKFVPVGAYEADGVFMVHFGEAYELKVERGLSAEEKDSQAARCIMRNIAKLLPSHLRGEFA